MTLSKTILNDPFHMKNQSPRPLCIKNGQVILKNSVIKNTTVFIENEKIESIGAKCPSSRAVKIDAKGLFVSPGFIDTHIHGDPESILKHETRYGTTAIVVALSCAAPGVIGRQIDRVRTFIDKNPIGYTVLGLRLEGPFISKEKAGAQNKRFIKRPSIPELRRIIARAGSFLKIVTIAPETKAGAGLSRILRKNNIIASIGHSNADHTQAAKGFDSGITHATHLFNGMRRMTTSDVGAAGACLADNRVSAEIICDMIHVPEALLRLAFTMKKRRILLITDSVRAEAHGGKTRGGVYRLKNGTIAGSRLTMIEAIKNVVTCCGVRLTDAISAATTDPARLLGVEDHKGVIAPGKDADIVLFDKDFNVKMTIARGRILYRKRGF